MILYGFVMCSFDYYENIIYKIETETETKVHITRFKVVDREFFVVVS
jgi:hypothetical protein